VNLKRVLDLTVALPLLVASTPLLLAFALAIRRRSPGPVWFVQQRAGRAGHQVRIWKLRTMHTDAAERLAQRFARDPEAARAYQKHAFLSDDPRVAGPVALFARRFGLDELPQLWNVARGELSLVGPRPIEQHLLQALFSEPERARRAQVTPGLTGLWQVRRSAASVASLRRYDLFYLQRRSLRLDLWILSQTPRALLHGRGA
jgi:lipopolysaccharide/colanic/teichoic acid biosynthesis glycosyltransferase